MPKEFVRPVPVIGSDSSLISINLMMNGRMADRGYVGKKDKAALSIRIFGRRPGDSKIGLLEPKGFRFWPDAANSQNRNELMEM